MHIIIAVLGSIVTILILFNRLKSLGIDLEWLNPFTWYRRRQWRQKVHQNPVYCMDQPMEAVAGLLYTAAKCSGDITQEHKNKMLSIFETDFELDDKKAVELLSSSSFLIKDEDDVALHLKKFLAPSIEKFSPNQLTETLKMVDAIIQVDAQPSAKQIQLQQQLQELLSSKPNDGDKWQS